MNIMKAGKLEDDRNHIGKLWTKLYLIITYIGEISWHIEFAKLITVK